MEDDDLDTSRTSLKRPRSRSLAPSPPPSVLSGSASISTRPDYLGRAPKRLRRSHDVPEYHTPVEAHGLAAANPMNRRMQKRAAKRTRREGHIHKTTKPAAAGMEIDDIGSVGTFFATSGFNFETEA